MNDITKDVNDNSLTFGQTVYRVGVMEDAEPWSQVEATSLDCENNEDIEYSITGEVGDSAL